MKPRQHVILIWLTAFVVFFFLLCASARATTYHVNYATGNDSNAGTSDASPWKTVPGMTGSTVAVTPSPDDNLLLDSATWPVTCFPFVPTYSGTAGHPIYIGTNGGAHPIWDCQKAGANSISGALDSMPSGKFANLDSSGYIAFDSIVVTNLNWAGTGNVYGFECGATTGITITNCPFLCLSNLTGGSGSDTLLYVYGPSASSLRVTHCTFTSLPNTNNWSGGAVYGATTFEYCNVGFMTDGFQGICYTNQYNIIHDIQRSCDPTEHENADYIFMPPTNSYVHHNIITNNPAGELLFITGFGLLPTQTNAICYVYDNLIGNNPGTLTPQIDCDPGQPNSTAYGTRGTVYLWNNTIQDSEPSGSSQGYIRVSYRSAGGGFNASSLLAVYGTNNFAISENTGQFFQLDAGAATVIYTNGTNLKINNATASAYGFTSANGWQPPSTSPTRGAGTSMAAFCAGIGVPWTDLLGVAFVADSSAYQYPGGGLPSVQISFGGSIPITYSPSGIVVTN